MTDPTSVAQQEKKAPTANPMDEMVGITGVGQQPLPNTRRTAFHLLANEFFGAEWVDTVSYGVLSSCMDLNRARKLKKGIFSIDEGIELTLNSGAKICYTTPSRYIQHEMLFLDKKYKLADDSAAALVAMARMRGWTVLNVHGKSLKDRELLWLAVQRQNLMAEHQIAEEKKLFEKLQQEGKIPAEQKYEPNPHYAAMKISNFQPLLDSPVLAQWQREVEAYKNATKGPQAPKAPEDKGAIPPKVEAPAPVDGSKKESVAATGTSPDRSPGIDQMIEARKKEIAGEVEKRKKDFSVPKL